MRLGLVKLFLVIFLISSPTVAADKAAIIKLGSIDGGTSVQVKRNGKSRAEKTGTILLPGDNVVTGPKKTVTILLSDGSVIVIGKNSQFEIKNFPQAYHSGELLRGDLRGLIRSGTKPKKKRPRRFRIMIKSKGAVMGVRGTDFVVTTSPQIEAAKFYTLEGQVEVAKTEKILEAGKGVPISGGEVVEVSPTDISLPEPFDGVEFLETLSKAQPGLSFSPVKETPAPSPTPAPKPDKPEKASLEWNHFQLFMQEMRFSDDANGIGPGWSFNPQLRIWNFVYLRSTFANWILPGSKHSFLAAEASVRLHLLFFSTAFVEFGPTAQIWFGSGQAAGGSFAAGVKLGKPFFGVIEHIFFGIQRVISSQDVREHPPEFGPPDNDGIRIGIGAALF